MGGVEIRPVSRKWERRVGLSNAYDGCGYVYIQPGHAHELIDLLPEMFFGRDKQVNDGVVFIIDSWTFRHMVGGQSD